MEEREPYIKVLIYGEPGAGKTVLAASAPNPLFLDVEHGTSSLLNHPELRGVKAIPIKSWSDIEEIFWECKEGNVSQETIVIDSISELQRKALDESLIRAAKIDPKVNPNLPQFIHYKENTQVLRRMVIAFRELEKHLVIVAHETIDKDESDGHMYRRPGVTPKLSDTLVGFMDVTGYLTRDTIEDKDSSEPGATKVVRKLQVHPTAHTVAKTRIGGLPTIIENPSFSVFQNALLLTQPSLV